MKTILSATVALLLLETSEAVKQTKFVGNDAPENVKTLQISNMSQVSLGLNEKLKEMKGLAEVLASELKEA